MKNRVCYNWRKKKKHSQKGSDKTFRFCKITFCLLDLYQLETNSSVIRRFHNVTLKHLHLISVAVLDIRVNRLERKKFMEGANTKANNVLSELGINRKK